MAGEVRTFVVQVWQRLGRYRAAVRPADGGPTSLFDEPAELARYLGADAPGTCAGEGPARHAADAAPGSRSAPPTRSGGSSC